MNGVPAPPVIPGTTDAAARIPTPTELALLEYAKQLVLTSASTIVDFNKTMLGVTASFGTLITTVIPLLIWGTGQGSIKGNDKFFILLPLALMLASAVFFALGCLPKTEMLKADVLQAIETSRAKIIGRRMTWAGLGMTLFIASLVATVGLAIWIKPSL
jgi:hypothetical protein